MAYLLLKRQYRDDHSALRELYELVGDTESLAALDRQIMGQSQKVEVTDVSVRHG